MTGLFLHDPSNQAAVQTAMQESKLGNSPGKPSAGTAYMAISTTIFDLTVTGTIQAKLDHVLTSIDFGDLVTVDHDMIGDSEQAIVFSDDGISALLISIGS
jgi:hypothetical protein